MSDFTKKRGTSWYFDWPITRPNAQTITIEGAPTNGTWTIAYTSEDGRTATTYGIAHNATNTAVQTALETLPNVNAGDVTVTGGPGPGTPWVVTINTAGAYVLAVAGTFTGGSGVTITVTQAPFNLTGATIYVTFKPYANYQNLADDTEGVFQYSWISGGAADNITVTTPANGVAVLRVPPTETVLYQAIKYAYDVKVKDEAGDYWSPDAGTLTVTAEVTKTVA